MQVVDKFVYNFKIEHESIYHENKYWDNFTECSDDDDTNMEMELTKKYKINTDDISCFIHNLCKTLNSDVDYLWEHNNNNKCKFELCWYKRYMFNTDNQGFTKIINKEITSNQYDNIYHINIIIKYKNSEDITYSHNIYNIILLVNNMKDEHIRKEYLMNCEKNNFHNILLGFENGYDPVRFKTLIHYLR